MSAMRDDEPNVSYTQEPDGTWWICVSGKSTKLDGPPAFMLDDPDDEETSPEGDKDK